MQIFGDENINKGERLGAKGYRRKGGSGEPMSEYDSDVMDKATGGKNATEQNKESG